MKPGFADLPEIKATDVCTCGHLHADHLTKDGHCIVCAVYNAVRSKKQAHPRCQKFIPRK